MKAVELVDSKKLKEVVTALNAAGGFLTEKVRAVGVKKGDIVKAFVEAIDNMDEAVKSRLSIELVTVAEFYNDLIADEIEGASADEEADPVCVCDTDASIVPTPVTAVVVPATVPSITPAPAATGATPKGRGKRAVTPQITPAPAAVVTIPPATVSTAKSEGATKTALIRHAFEASGSNGITVEALMAVSGHDRHSTLSTMWVLAKKAKDPIFYTYNRATKTYFKELKTTA